MMDSRRRALGGAFLALLLTLTSLTPSCHHDDDDVECFASDGTIVCFRDDHHHHHITSEGTLAVALTDSPVELRSFFLTFTELVLLSDEIEPQTVYRSDDGLRVDLLSLQGTPENRLYELLVRKAVPAAAYNGARLFFRAPGIVTESGGVDDELVTLAAESIEIRFARPFVVGPAEDRFLVLDLDVAHSVTSPTGSKATWGVRPLVLAEPLNSAKELSTPLDLEGEIVAMGEDGSFTLKLTDSRGETSISTPSPEAEIREAGSTSASVEAISSGRRATVRGSFQDDGSFTAQLVALDETEDLDREGDESPDSLSESDTERLDGVVQRRFPQTRTIQLTSANGTLRTVELAPNAEILSLELRDNVLWQEPLDLRHLTSGMKVELSLGNDGDRVERLVVPQDNAVHAR